MEWNDWGLESIIASISIIMIINLLENEKPTISQLIG